MCECGWRCQLVEHEQASKALPYRQQLSLRRQLGDSLHLVRFLIGSTQSSLPPSCLRQGLKSRFRFFRVHTTKSAGDDAGSHSLVVSLLLREEGCLRRDDHGQVCFVLARSISSPFVRQPAGRMACALFFVGGPLHSCPAVFCSFDPRRGALVRSPVISLAPVLFCRQQRLIYF